MTDLEVKIKEMKSDVTQKNKQIKELDKEVGYFVDYICLFSETLLCYLRFR